MSPNPVGLQRGTLMVNFSSYGGSKESMARSSRIVGASATRRRTLRLALDARAQTYYVTVQARNAGGLWSVNAVSNAVVAPPRDAGYGTPAHRRSPKIFLPTVRNK